MAEEEDWTVVNSKSSRSKKGIPNRADEVPANRPHPQNRRLQGERKQGKNRSAEGRRDIPGGRGQSHQSQRKFDKSVGTSGGSKSYGRQVVAGTGTSSVTQPSQPMPIRLLKRGADLGQESFSSSPPSVPGPRNVGSPSVRKVENEANKVSTVTTAQSSKSSVNPVNTKQHFPGNALPRPQPQSHLDNVQPQPESSSAVQDQDTNVDSTNPKKKKRKRDSKECRRKKREEKFYQALYQNKDSHIQFVSADVIRKLKSGNEERHSFSKNRNRTTTNSATATTSLQNPSISETEAFQSFGNFPLLTSCSKDDTTTPGPSYRLACSSKPNSTPGSNAKVTFTVVAGEELVPSPVAVAEPSPKLTPVSSKARKSKQPLVIDVSELIVKKKEKDLDKRLSHKESPSVSTPVKANALKKNHKLTAGNPLDSSGPGVIHRGKIRNKQKKPTKLKLTILKSRTLRKMLLESQVRQGEDEQSNATTGDNDGKVSMTDEIGKNIEDSVEVESTDNSPPELISLVQTIKIEKSDTTDSAEDMKPKIKIERPDTGSVEAMVQTVKIEKPDTDLDEDAAPTIKIEKSDACSAEDMVQPMQVSGEGDVLSASSDVVVEDEEKVVDPNNENIPSCPTDFQLKFSELLDEVSRVRIEETIPRDVELLVKSSMHNRKFRDYCDMYTSKELHHQVVTLLSELFRFQDRLYHNDPIKFKTKRRFVSGLKEALTYLNLNKVQLLLIAPDIEKNPEPGGLDDKINQILTLARGNNVPYIFSGSKYNLGKPTRVKTPISIIAVLDKQNCEEMFRTLLSEADLLREKYKNDFISKVRENIKGET